MTVADTLVRLQEVDLELLKHASTLSAMPQRKRLATIELAARKVATELKGIVGQRKDAETDISDAEVALAHYREKTAEVQAAADAGEHTHREIRDFEQQLTSLAKRIEKSEYTLRPLREKLERLERAERNARATAERLESERAATESALAEGSSSLRAEIVRLSHERDELAGRLEPELLERYEAARKRFKGLAVERLRGNVPSICRVKLQPSSFHDLAQGEEIAECPYCHRMLITSEEGQQ
ncbi:zinc ribbon domain-containing protein [Thermophilibacter sp.]|uniref:zinc ribbon domain-containing protein n=1 Tax=Thermophilibacter sp. TaxID=2847309 RepID=UPI003A90188A